MLSVGHSLSEFSWSPCTFWRMPTYLSTMLPVFLWSRPDPFSSLTAHPVLQCVSCTILSYVGTRVLLSPFIYLSTLIPRFFEYHLLLYITLLQKLYKWVHYACLAALLHSAFLFLPCILSCHDTFCFVQLILEPVWSLHHGAADGIPDIRLGSKLLMSKSVSFCYGVGLR